MTDKQVTSVLIVDDSAMVRKVLSMGFEADPAFRVVGVAHNTEMGQKLLEETRPDVVTLDIEMPHVDGLTWLKQIMSDRPVPVVIISSFGGADTDQTLAAMEMGAVDVIRKPMVGIGGGLGPLMDEIRCRVRAAARANLRRVPLRRAQVDPLTRTAWPMRGGQKIMAIGSSTGGVQALARILPLFPANSPAILIVQHMPEGFTTSFARRLDGLCSMDVREAADDDIVQDGQVLIAPGGNRHMVVRRSGGLFRIALIEGAPVCFASPSVDVLFKSMAETVGRNASAAILTGMGRDGAAGLLELRKAGARTYAQNAETCVVYGMPAAAVEAGAAQQTLPLDNIPAMLLHDDPSPSERANAFSPYFDDPHQLRRQPS